MYVVSVNLNRVLAPAGFSGRKAIGAVAQKARFDERRVISGIIHVFKSDGRWIDAPLAYGVTKPLHKSLCPLGRQVRLDQPIPCVGGGRRTTCSCAHRLFGREGASFGRQRQKWEKSLNPKWENPIIRLNQLARLATIVAHFRSSSRSNPGEQRPVTVLHVSVRGFSEARVSRSAAAFRRFLCDSRHSLYERLSDVNP